MTKQRKSFFHRPFGTTETPKASATGPVENRGSQDPAEEGQDYTRQMAERRRLEKETQDYIDGLRRETAQRQREASDRRHEEFLRYIRGEEVIGRIEIIKK